MCKVVCEVCEVCEVEEVVDGSFIRESIELDNKDVDMSDDIDEIFDNDEEEIFEFDEVEVICKMEEFIKIK